MTIRFVFKPGERLNEVEIAKRLDMSRAPIREAMNRLVTEGLVTVVPNQGFSCRRLSASETTSLYQVRGDLETAAAMEILRTSSREAILELKDFWDRVTEEQETASIDMLVQRDEEFHLRLVALAGNPERVRILQNINARIQFVRRINLEDPVRRKQSFAEHDAIIEKLLGGNDAAAATLLRRHLTVSAEEAAASVSQGLARIYAESVA